MQPNSATVELLTPTERNGVFAEGGDSCCEDEVQCRTIDSKTCDEPLKILSKDNCDTSEGVNPLDLDVKPANEEQLESASTKRRCPCIQKPEGGQAWLVAVVSLVMTYVVATEMASFALLYVSYTEHYSASNSAVGWIKGIQTIAGGTISIFAGTFMKVYGCRRVLVLAGCCLFVGMFSASFSPNIYVTYLTQGVILGSGISMTTMAVAVGIQQHFTRNKVLGSGIANFGFTVGGFSGPLFTSFLLEHYGVRGTMLILSAVFAHVIPCGLLSRRPSKSKRAGSDPNDDDTPIRTRIWNEMSDVTLLHDPLFVCFLVAGLSTYYNMATFLSHFASRALHYGIPRGQTAYLQSLSSVASSVARVPCTFLANIKSVNKVLVYSLGITLMATSSTVYGLCDTIETMIIAPIIFGIGVGSATTVFSVALVHLVSLERLPRAYSLFQVVIYSGMTLGPPISGLIFDKTNNYDYPYFLSGGMALCGSITCLIVTCLDHRRRKRTKTVAFSIEKDVDTCT